MVPHTQPLHCALVNLGCRVNHAEIEAMRTGLLDKGVHITTSDIADIVVVNTCAVTGEAEAKSRKAIRRLAQNPTTKKVFVTGCAAYLFSNTFQSLSHKVELIHDKKRIPDAVCETRVTPAIKVSVLSSDDTLARLRREIKIQDGCNNACSYCIVRKARGQARSVPVEEILHNVKHAIDDGIGEIVLTGINLGQFRLDDAFSRNKKQAPDATSLAALIQYLLETTSIGRIRLSSIEPTDIDDSLIALMAKHPKRIASYLHVPLQSGSDYVLKEMNRPYTVHEYEDLMLNIRKQLPHIALATDIIVGFPGETDEHFQETIACAERFQFSKIHHFRYSQRPGTPAAERPDQVSPKIKTQRSHELARVARRMRSSFAEKLIGTEVDVYVEASGRGKAGGLFDARVPDGLVVGLIHTVMVQGVDNDTLICCDSC